MVEPDQHFARAVAAGVISLRARMRASGVRSSCESSAENRQQALVTEARREAIEQRVECRCELRQFVVRVVLALSRLESAGVRLKNRPLSSPTGAI
jgi:hypothetical protein